MRRPSALVHGLAVSGIATARALQRRGYRVITSDDSPTDAKRAMAAELDVEFIECPDQHRVELLVRSVDLVAPAPGVPETHAVVLAALAGGVALRTEIDLAYEWEQDRPGGPRPMIAVTGTDGKTTTTLMVAALLEAGGHRAAAVGNTERPLIDALDDPVDVFAVECSSFRLSWLKYFRAEAAIWLNLAPDHLNWHTSMASYEAAKANVWRLQRSSDVAIGWADDPTVMRHLTAAPARHTTFGLAHGDYHTESLTAGDGSPGSPASAGAVALVGPSGHLASSRRLVRRFPHDLTNALAAAAACVESGLVDRARIGDGLQSFRFPPHRIEPVADHDGIQWYNDSKATTPHAVLTAIRSFDSLVLIAGGRNKDLDLRSLALEPGRMRGVVAIGEAADEVAAAFDGLCPIARARTMNEAVHEAAALARPGDVVLLSPACASFDWYPDGGYLARGDDFKMRVRQFIQNTEVTR